MKKYRLYIDESGSHEYSDKDSIKSRYLGLLGVVVESGEYETNIQPRVIELKKMFSNDADDLVVLHRDEIANLQGPFSKLSDEEFKNNFDSKLKSLFKEGEYLLLGVVLDKKTHYARYKTSALHPYHYCLNVILERYVFYLEEVGGVGDVMSEARGKNEDSALRGAYSNFFNNGTYFCKAPRVQAKLTSKAIKLRTKENTTQGLEMADLLVLATKILILFLYKKIGPLTGNFNKQVMRWVWSKFRRELISKRVKGYGIKLIE
ncbi:MAG TPA: DUF3800 domain-containing protein [Candidatus Woesebacteria bacterium]|nr:DUF3800 domain-containing protein [Candidatus Woesebacteria bacterium]